MTILYVACFILGYVVILYLAILFLHRDTIKEYKRQMKIVERINRDLDERERRMGIERESEES